MRLFLDILYTGSVHQDSDYKIVLDALNLAHGWDVQSVVQVLSETLRDQITAESISEISNAAALQGPETLQRACAAFTARNSRMNAASLTPAALKMLGFPPQQLGPS